MTVAVAAAYVTCVIVIETIATVHTLANVYLSYFFLFLQALYFFVYLKPVSACFPLLLSFGLNECSSDSVVVVVVNGNFYGSR